jgi:DNA-binding MarR family transcriptional regulator
MELTKHRIIIAYTGVLVIFFIGFSLPVSGVIYHFEDDFSSTQSNDWTFESVNREARPYEYVNDTFIIENGQLVSSGAFNPFETNSAYLIDTTVNGAWSFDVYVPSRAEGDIIFQGLFSVMMSERQMGPPELGANLTRFPNFALHVTIGKLETFAWNGTDENANLRSVFFTKQKFDRRQHYDIVRTLDRLYVFVDGSLIQNRTLSANIGPINNYFTINTGKGNGIRFDNFKITNDFNSKLNEILESATKFYNNPLFFAIGAGSVVLAGSVSYWRITKKKELAKLIKISSNGDFSTISQSISQVFDDKKSLYFLLLGHKTYSTNLLDAKLEAEMKSEMQQFKHILHPIRLSIMQILFTNPKISSTELRHRLDLSMSDYYNSVKPLEKLNLIRLYDDFDEDGSSKQFVLIEERGKGEFAKFIKLVSKYVEQTKDFIPDYDGTDLYP